MPRRLYDCAMFNGEFELLALRIRELEALAHRFVVIESDTTFSGRSKAVKFSKDHPAIRAFADRIDFILVADMPDTDDPWQRETWQRNAALRGVVEAADDDLVLMSDVDEIPRAESVQQALADQEFAAFGFRMSTYYFFMNYKFVGKEPKRVWSVAATADLLKTHQPDALRYAVRDGKIRARIFDQGGWHFSYLMDDAAIREKLRSFSHQEYSHQDFLKKVNREKLVIRSKGLFGSRAEWAIVDEVDLPRYVLEHREEFAQHFTKRTVAVAWFEAVAGAESRIRRVGGPAWHFLKANLKRLRGG
jgi:hypothetical protein